jgi:asparagine synthase (glutamine-hydrolysing)
MCGILGYSKQKVNNNINDKFIDYGINLLKNRGPDDNGDFYNADRSIGLAHTRLSILDLSKLGHQPMFSSDERYVLVYNGEIYNFKELRSDLVKHFSFKSNSDSEVILYSYIHYGNSFLEKLNGIFSLAIYDRKEDQLIIARDRFGTKPLYYVKTPSGLYFASELKALMTLDDLALDIDYSAIENYMTYLWSPSPSTPLKAIKKLEAGHYLIVKNSLIVKKDFFFEVSYNESKETDIEKIIETTDLKLKNAITSQLVSDVPVGAFLSGGLDSSAIVAYVKNYTDVKLPTFTIRGKNDLGMADDFVYAKKVGKYLGVDVHPIDINHEIFFDIEEMIYCLDEPQADLAPILVSYISKIAKEEHGIKVLLSGVGGDDIFSGYRRHQAIELDSYISKIPKLMRGKIRDLVQKLPSNSNFMRRLKKYTRYFDLDGDDKIISYFNWIDKDTRRNLFSSVVKSYLENENHDTSFQLKKELEKLPKETSDLNKMLSLDLKFFLPDHNLNYTDKMGMKEGVEIRVPLLDNKLVDFASTIPGKYKQNGKHGKYIFKKTMEKYLPNEVIYRSKTGFGTPLKSWIHGELKEYINTILSKEAIDKRGIFNYSSFQEILSKDKLGHEDYSYTILSMLSIELWFKIFIDNRNKLKMQNRKTSIIK